MKTNQGCTSTMLNAATSNCTNSYEKCAFANVWDKLPGYMDIVMINAVTRVYLLSERLYCVYTLRE